MTDTTAADEHDQPGTIHLHVLGQRDDLHRARITLTAAILAMHDDWPSQLAHDLFLDVLFQLTILCKIEVTSGDTF